MNTRWAMTICCNAILFTLLCWRRPKRFKWLWVSQSFVIAATGWNVWSWYHLSDDLYNSIWWKLDLAQAWLELMVILALVRNYLSYSANEDAIAILALSIHLELWLLEYWHWDVAANDAGQSLLTLRKWSNIAAIISLSFAVYYRSKRDCAKEKHMSEEEQKPKPIKPPAAAQADTGEGDPGDDGSGPKGNGGHGG